MFQTNDEQSNTLSQVPDSRSPVEVNAVQERIEKTQVCSDSGLAYYYFASEQPRPDLPLFVAVHGIRRRAIDQVRLFAPLIDSLGGAMIAPVYQRKRFSDYQRLGRSGKGERSDLALQRMVADLKNSREVHFDGMVMFGYSGGGQFVHRYAMAYPRQVRRLAIAAPGWFTFPDLDVKFPEGVRKTAELPDLGFDAARFLKIPAIVLVGEMDTLRDKTLNQQDRIDRRQGYHRVERGRRWTSAMSASAAQFGYDTDYRFETVPTCGHSFVDCMMQGGMGPKVIQFLFNPDRETTVHVDYRAIHSRDASPLEGGTR